MSLWIIVRVSISVRSFLKENTMSRCAFPLLLVFLLSLFAPAEAQQRKKTPHGPTPAVQVLLDRTAKQTGDEKYRLLEEAFWKAEQTHDEPGFEACVTALYRVRLDLFTTAEVRAAYEQLLKRNLQRGSPGRIAAGIYGILGWTANEQTEPKQAKEYFERSIALYKQYAPRDTLQGLSYRGLAYLFWDKMSPKQFESYLRHDVDVWHTEKPNTGGEAVALYELGRHIVRKRKEEGLQYLRKAVAILEKQKPIPWNLIVALENLADGLKYAGKETEARRVAERAILIRKRITPASKPHGSWDACS
jgi:tetratricopeptide (TPR) repeat protein